MTTPRSSDERFSSDIRLSGLGLHLREWTNADLPAMVDLFDETQVDRWTPLRHPFDLAAARAYLDAARARRAEGRSIQLAITTDGHTPRGEILLFPTGPGGRDPHGRHAELAYAIGAAHRRQGLATTAVRLITSYAYQQLGMEHVILRIHPDNTASTALARATGFDLTDVDPIEHGAAGPLLTWRHRPSSTDDPHSLDPT
jgi:RimJ/RimL family protein N-acetyltransferase